ncbi:MAG: phosphomannomutase, partial [Aeromonadaceae bacterium]
MTTVFNSSAVIASSGIAFGTSGARGLVVDFTPEVCAAFTHAFVAVMQREFAFTHMALAIDNRPSSLGMAQACAAALHQAGIEPLYYGVVPTPALAYKAMQDTMPCIMITGSHIPFDRNGIKFYGMSGEISKSDENHISAAVVHLPDDDLVTDLPGVNPGARQCYIDRYLRFFPENCLAGMKLGFYEHSSVARDLLRDILERLGASVISLGRTNEFVPIDTEAVSEADAQRARDWAGLYGFDAIISTDGDADRPLVGDEFGQWLRGDVAGILSAQCLGAQAVATTVSCNTAVELCGAFGQVIRTRIGSPYVIEAMEAQVKADGRKIVGFEPNGGFLVGSSFEK